MLHELKNILSSLDQLIGKYSIYSFLVDQNGILIWLNQYTRHKMPTVSLGNQVSDYPFLWPYPNTAFSDIFSADPEKYSEVKSHLIKKAMSTENAHKNHLEFFSLPVLSPQKELEGYYWIGADINENEHLREQLSEKEKLFTTIINTSTDAIISLDSQHYVSSWNIGAETVFGYTAAEIIGHPISKLLPTELLELNELNYIQEELLSKGFIKNYETQRRHKDGHLIYVNISSTLLHDKTGKIIGASEIIKDIDSRKKLEFKLLRTILELSKINELNEILYGIYEETEILRIILIAITAGEGLRFNRAFLLLINQEQHLLKGELAIGPSDEEEASRLWDELNRNPQHLTEIVQLYQIDLRGTDKTVNEIATQIEIPLTHKNHVLIKALNNRQILHVKAGKLIAPQHDNITFEWNGAHLLDILKNDDFIIAPLYSKKEPLGLIIADNCIIRRDITNEDIESLKLFANQASSAIENARLYRTLEFRIKDLQAAYQQLEQNQQQLLRSERLAAIGEMSAKIAHEIRNPLVAIGGFARLIEKKILEDATLKQYARIIRDQVMNLEYILNNLLSTANPQKPQQRSVNITQTIQRVLEILKGSIEQREIIIQESFQHDGAHIFGDEKMIHQAILNLTKNAVEAFNGSETLREIHLSTHIKKDWLELSIYDTGSGIEIDLLNKIFHSFFTTKTTGTGLGLSIVKQIIESHNGKINVESQKDKGTTFYLSFPLSRESAG